MHEIFEMQADLNNRTFEENDCYIYIEQKSINEFFDDAYTLDLNSEVYHTKGNFSDLCVHIQEKPNGIKYVRLPQGKEGMWVEIIDEKSWETIQGWWLNAYNLAIKQEAAELTDSTNWKWWRTKVDKFDSQNLKVEIIDVLHFWLCQCMVMGMGFDDVKRIYKQKNEVNFQRQASGYIVKDKNDCKEIE